MKNRDASLTWSPDVGDCSRRRSAILAAALLAWLTPSCSTRQAPAPAPPRPVASALGPETWARVASAAANLDKLVLAGLEKAGKKPNAPVEDAAFVRRIHLDVIGRIPTRAEAEAFLADPAPDKRARLIDRLLAAPGYTMHTFNWLADTLRVRDRIGKRPASTVLFQDWLEEQIAGNRPWDEIVRDMVTADGALADSGPAGFLLRDAQMPLDGVSNLLTTFLGADVACAQCHDHPSAEWTRKDFYQMAAFFGASDGFHEGFKKQVRKLTRSGAVSADAKELQRLIGPASIYKLVDFPQNKLVYPDDYQYDNARAGERVQPALIAWRPEERRGPAYQVDLSTPERLRDEFARWLTHPENPRFAAAIANRLWKKAFGLGVQEPVTDLDYPAGASNPELLAALGRLMTDVRFDLREFQRVLFNTAAYQRQASPAPDGEDGAYLFPGPLYRRMTAEQAWDSILVLAAGPRIDGLWLHRGDELRKYSLGGRELSPESVNAMLARLEAQDETGDMEAMEEKPGKPGKAERKKGKRRGGKQAEMAARYEGGVPERRGRLLLARASELPQPAPETHFLRQFGQSDRQVANDSTTDGSVPQVMALMNGPVQEIVTGRGSFVLADTATASSPDARTKALFVSFLGRAPTAGEERQTTEALAGGLKPPDLAWVLLNHREFLFVP